MIKYLPQVQLNRSSLWRGISSDGQLSTFRLNKQKVPTFPEALDRVNKYPDLPARVIVIFRNGSVLRNGQYWLICNIVDEISETLEGSKNA